MGSEMCIRDRYRAIKGPNKKLGVINLNKLIIGLVVFTNILIKKKDESSL